MEYNIYCDESCGLENDGIKVMVLGAIWCEKEKKDGIFRRIREIKTEYGLSEKFEIKWHKVSASKQNFYLRIVDYFFDDEDIHFRSLVVPDKSVLNCEEFGLTREEFYCKMYFDLLKGVFAPASACNVYIDIKDTRSQRKIELLTKELRSNYSDNNKTVRQIRSHEAELLPLADMLIGAIGYYHRGLNANQGKMAVIKQMQKRSGYSLKNSSIYCEDKLNLFIWEPEYAVDIQN
ncbi:MAG: DUF3800 domain-containing protein [Prevotellaceae bacterium]|jgi:hypothetical protein|nr:DUF3800 domain-containing protein [Prevotellaceae bacterium]